MNAATSSFTCNEPTCRWAVFNGAHPDRLHAVWWGCTKRPARPFRIGQLVKDVSDPTGGAFPVDHLEWSEGTGWGVAVRYADHAWGVTVVDPNHLKAAS
jgi:hypothetical protein